MIAAAGVALGIVLPLPASAAADEPVITNAGFESGEWGAQTQHAHAAIVEGGANGTKYAARIGLAYEGDSLIPIDGNLPTRGQNTHRGSVNQQITGVKPNTSYEFEVWIKGRGIRWGVFELESGDAYYTGSTAGAEKAIYTGVDSPNGGTEWQKQTVQITTGARTTELNGFCILTNQTDPAYCDEFKLTEIGPSADPKTLPTAWTERPETAGKFPVTIPEVQKFVPAGHDKWQPATISRFVVDQQFADKILDEVQLSAAQFVNRGIAPGLKVDVGSTDDVPADGVFFTLGDPDLSSAPAKAAELKDQAYSLTIGKDGATVRGGGEAGVLYGATTLLQALQGKSVPVGVVSDWTDQPIRGLQIDSARRYFSLDWLEEQLKELAFLKMNTLSLRIKDNEGMRVESDVLPHLVDHSPDGGSWTKAQVREFVLLAKKYHIQVIPEVDIPEHSDMDRKVYPQYFRGKVWDFTDPTVRDLLTRFVRETGDTFDAPYVHIGADEVTDRQTITPAVTAWLAGEGIADASFHDGLKYFANGINAALKEDGRRMMLWNDELKLGGNVTLDKDVTVVYWASISSSPYADQFADAGYPIIGSSSDLYHDIWPPLASGAYKKETINGPSPQKMLTYYSDPWVYPTASFGDVPKTRPLSSDAQKSQSQGQLFPVWDDAMGWPPEPLLSKSLFPRLRVHAQTVWNSPRSISQYSELDPYLQFYSTAPFFGEQALFDVPFAAKLRVDDGVTAEMADGGTLPLMVHADYADGTTAVLDPTEMVVTSDSAADRVNGAEVTFNGPGARVLTIQSATDPLSKTTFQLKVVEKTATEEPTPTEKEKPEIPPQTPENKAVPSETGSLATTGVAMPWMIFGTAGLLVIGGLILLTSRRSRKTHSNN